MNALGNTWHAEHFVCAECQKPFVDGRFRRKDDKVYCIEDHTKLFGTKCAQCDVVIEGSYMSALGKQYHSDCFACNVSVSVRLCLHDEFQVSTRVEFST